MAYPEPSLAEGDSAHPLMYVVSPPAFCLAISEKAVGRQS